MFGLRILWFLNRITTTLFYKCMYRHSIVLPFSCKFRFGFNIVIASKKAKIKIGDNCFFNNYCSINAMSTIQFGNDVIVGENVKIYDHNHKYNNSNVLIKEQGFSLSPVVIGNNCWIGSNVTILKGVTIGDNCVIGAGCVIFKNVPSNTLVINKQELIFKNYI